MIHTNNNSNKDIDPMDLLLRIRKPVCVKRLLIHTEVVIASTNKYKEPKKFVRYTHTATLTDSNDLLVTVRKKSRGNESSHLRNEFLFHIEIVQLTARYYVIWSKSTKGFELITCLCLVATVLLITARLFQLYQSFKDFSIDFIYLSRNCRSRYSW